jgi:hypothetical protein
MCGHLLMKRLLFIILLSLIFSTSEAQEDPVVKSVTLDEVVIRASLGGNFSTEDFILMVREDSSFYEAFKNLRLLNYGYSGNLKVRDKSGRDKAELQREARQHVRGGKRWVEIEKEKKKGRLQHRNGEFRYFTAAMFHYVFYPEDTITVESNGNEARGSSRQQKFYQKLKYLMFNPGSSIEGVPFVGHRLAIFDEGLRPYYDYFISYGNCPAGGDCYIFTSKVKEEAEEERKPVIRELVSYFDVETGRIMYRSYKMNLTSLLYDFDVSMEIYLKPYKDSTVPTSVSYSGWWNIPFKKAEFVDFSLQFYDFEDEIKD